MYRELLQNALLNNYKVRTEILEGKEYLVAPTVMLTLGVHPGSFGPVLYTEEEVAKAPQSWNGRPIPIQHTTGSCNTPENIQNQTVGKLFNVQYIEGKLKGEIWVDKEKISIISPKTLEMLNQQRQLEVSTAMFFDLDPTQGNHEGEHYIGIVRNIVPDHFALLPGGQGACDWTKGCGVRNEKGGVKEVQENNIIENQEQPIDEGFAKMLGKNVMRLLGIGKPDNISTDEPINNEKGETVEMATNEKVICCPEKVNQLISNSVFTENDREWLEGLEESKIDKLLAMNVDAIKEEEEVTVDEVASAAVEETIQNAASAQQFSKEDFEAIHFVKNEIGQKRNALIARILANANNSYTKEELNDKSTDDLTKISRFVGGGDFSLAGGFQRKVENAVAEEPMLAPYHKAVEKK